MIRPLPDTVRKIDALEAAIRGDVLTAEQERALAAVADDYRDLVGVGNGKEIAREHVIEAFRIIKDDVRFMTGWRRRQAVILLNAVQARGFEKVSPSDLAIDPADAALSEDMASDVDAEEIMQAVGM